MKFKLFIIFLLIFIISCKSKVDSEKSSKKVSAESNKKSEFKLENFTYTDTIKGKTVWELLSKSAVFNNKTRIADLNNVKILYKGKYIIESKKGTYNMSKKIAKLYDTVTIKSDNFTFYTDSLVFLDKEKKIFTNSKVKLKGDNIFVKADSFIGYLDKKKFVLKGNVYTEIR